MEKLYKATIFQVNEELGYIQNGAFHDHFITTDKFGNIEYKITLQPHRKIIGTIIPPYYLKEKTTGIIFPIISIHKKIGLGYTQDCHDQLIHTFVISADDYQKNEDIHRIQWLPSITEPNTDLLTPLDTPEEFNNYLHELTSTPKLSLKTELLALISKGEKQYQQKIKLNHHENINNPKTKKLTK